jgi:hypothetical protein
MQSDQDRVTAMQTRSFSGIVFLAGVWLIISPFILSYGSGAVTWNQVIFGVIIAILGIIRYNALSAVWASWLSALAGLWMITAPFDIASATGAARWSSTIAGLVTLLLSLAITSSPSVQTTHLHNGHPAM